MPQTVAANALPSKVSADFCVSPIGSSNPSMKTQISKVETIVKQSGLPYKMHEFGTRIDGDWQDVMNVVGQAHTMLHDDGIEKVHTDVRIETKTY